MLSSKRWIALVLVIVFCVSAILSICCYILDPFMYYRMDDSKKVLNSRFVNMGIIKNYKYDTAIIGSSLVQNFNMDSFRKNLGWNPVKLTISGMTINEVLKIYTLSQKYSSAKRYVINVDMKPFDADWNFDLKSKKLPEYLYNNTSIDDIKYLLGYEPWMRFIPVDAVINASLNLKVHLPKKLEDLFNNETQIDKIADWSKEARFGKDIVFDYYKNRTTASEVNTNGLNNRLYKSIDNYLNILLSQKKKDQEIIFIFPPYSALFWIDAKKGNYFNEFISAKAHFIKKCNALKNIRIIDMQGLNLISDLSHYKDDIHFDPVIQSMVIDAMKSGEYDTSIEKNNKNSVKLNSILDEFYRSNYAWIP